MNELASKQRPDEGLRELALFAGAGGGILGGKLLGWRTVCAVEWDDHARDVLAARQNDGCLEPFPIWNDVQTFDGHPWQGRVDVISGGFPCTDISAAGKGAGIDGKASSMWSHMARIIGEVRPRFVFVENSPLLVGRGLARVLGDLAKMGYDAKWGVLGAHHVGAPHKRDRIWIVADAAKSGLQRHNKRQHIPAKRTTVQGVDKRPGCYWDDLPKPRFIRRFAGVAEGVERIKRTGNGQVPAVVKLAWDTLTDHRDHTADTNNEQATSERVK